MLGSGGPWKAAAHGGGRTSVDGFTEPFGMVKTPVDAWDVLTISIA